MNDVDVLIPEAQEIKVGVRSYLLVKLSFSQITKITRFVTKVILEKGKEFDKLAEKFKTSKNNFEDALDIMELIPEEEIYQFFGIILKEEDIKYLEDNLIPEDMTEIIAVVCENNSILTVKKNIERTKKAVRKQMGREEKKED